MLYDPKIVRENASGYSRFTIDDVLFEQRKIFFTDMVTDESMEHLLKQLMILNSNDDANSEITLYINSPGGNVTSGMPVYHYMLSMQAPLRTVCTGSAASMGSLLFLAGEKREMMPNTSIMIHDPSYGNGNALAGLKPHEIQVRLDSLTEIQNMIVHEIASRCGKTEEEIKELTKTETYFNAEQAIEFGIAHDYYNETI